MCDKAGGSGATHKDHVDVMKCNVGRDIVWVI